MVVFDEDYLAHYGVLRRSGRYPWGSGGTQHARNMGFLDYLAEMRKKGLTDTQIAQGIGISTTEFRAVRSRARAEVKQQQISQALKLKEKGYSGVAAAAKMGIPEPTYRTLIADGARDKVDVIQQTAAQIRKEVDQKRFVDVGAGNEIGLGVSPDRMKAALAYLVDEGYMIHRVKIPQLGTGKETDTKVLGVPGSKQREIWEDKTKIKTLSSYSEDGGRTWSMPTHKPIPVNPKRVKVRYAEEGGSTADGVIYVRPGVKDLTLDGASYAQVRIQVGANHYLKGMAMYRDDLPDGVDLVFNTNKTRKEAPDPLDAMKPLKDDPELPFGSVVRQVTVNTGTPKERNISAMNLVNEEGDWSGWSKNLADQMLSKQPLALARQQLDVTYERRKKAYDEIMEMTNPTVKRKLLEELADEVDAAAVHLKAAALPGQSTHVILPIDSLSPKQIYAPKFQNGEEVALVRYPHGGTFEIPILTVNNRHRESRALLGNAQDAVGINHKVAERLSGADFDGDAVLVIPQRGANKVKSTAALEQLRGFDPKVTYKGYPGMKVMSDTQTQMGKISNLITDMTVRGAPTDEIARAVKHSMVVIDAEKHGLNHKQSSVDNGIKDLVAKYQAKPEGGRAGGASTLLSRARGEVYVPDFKPRPHSEGGPIDAKTGRKVTVPSGKVNWRTGKPKEVPVERLSVVDDAHKLSSGQPVEKIYADHSNRLKNLANQARLDMINTPPLKRSPSAAKVYAPQVARLREALAVAKANAPLERQAQILANAEVLVRRQASPDMSVSTRKKLESQALTKARIRTGAKKQRIEISPDEWEAIQQGAVSNSMLTEILANADMDVVKSYARPKDATLMTSAKTRRAEAMLARGFTRAEIAKQLGVSISTLDRTLYGEGG